MYRNHIFCFAQENMKKLPSKAGYFFKIEEIFTYWAANPFWKFVYSIQISLLSISAGTPQTSSLPYPIINPTQASAWVGGSTSGSTAGTGGFYPGLAGFMGLELSEDVLRANMPEYLPENQVALRQSVRIFFESLHI